MNGLIGTKGSDARVLLHCIAFAFALHCIMQVVAWLFSLPAVLVGSILFCSPGDWEVCSYTHATLLYSSHPCKRARTHTHPQACVHAGRFPLSWGGLSVCILWAYLPYFLAYYALLVDPLVPPLPDLTFPSLGRSISVKGALNDQTSCYLLLSNTSSV